MGAELFEEVCPNGWTINQVLEIMGFPHASIVRCNIGAEKELKEWCRDHGRRFEDLPTHALYIDRHKAYEGTFESCQKYYFELIGDTMVFDTKARKLAKKH